MLTRRTFLPCFAASALHGQTKPLNFVFILIDDYGWKDTGYNGSTYYETPNIDRLAREGMQFTNGYAAAPVCTPTRAAIMTGKYPGRLHMTCHIQGARHNKPYSKLIAPTPEINMPHSELTIAEILKPKGYATASIGKWHLGSTGYHPAEHGFDVNIGGTYDGSPRSFFYPGWEGKPANLKGRDGEYLTDLLTNEATKFIRANRNQPFFLYLPHYAVHVPIEAKKELVAKFDAKARSGEQNYAEYAAMIASVDESVGQILSTLRETGTEGNTVVFFTADNGGVSSLEWRKRPVTSNLPLRAGKGHLYEGGIRVPALVKWPGVTKAGSISHEPVSSIDYFPTIAEMAGVRWDGSHRVDGISLTRALRGGRLPERNLFWHFPHYSPQLGRPSGAIRRGPWKLIEHFETGTTELYNLGDDISESKDLSARQPERSAAMHAALKGWREEIRAQMPSENPHYDKARELENGPAAK
ncbi:MAG: sulfatase [Bryobacterales bacterium]|nr:sulfatase [Bryobacterales bacterium]